TINRARCPRSEFFLTSCPKATSSSPTMSENAFGSLKSIADDRAVRSIGNETRHPAQSSQSRAVAIHETTSPRSESIDERSIAFFVDLRGSSWIFVSLGDGRRPSGQPLDRHDRVVVGLHRLRIDAVRRDQHIAFGPVHFEVAGLDTRGFRPAGERAVRRPEPDHLAVTGADPVEIL